MISVETTSPSRFVVMRRPPAPPDLPAGALPLNISFPDSNAHTKILTSSRTQLRMADSHPEEVKAQEGAGILERSMISMCNCQLICPFRAKRWTSTKTFVFACRIMCSDQFTFRIGGHGKKFVVHSASFALQSKALDCLMNGNMIKGSDRSAIWGDVDEEGFIRFCQFAYTEDYTTPFPTVEEVSKDILPTLALSDVPSPPDAFEQPAEDAVPEEPIEVIVLEKPAPHPEEPTFKVELRSYSSPTWRYTDYADYLKPHKLYPRALPSATKYAKVKETFKKTLCSTLRRT